MIMVGVALVALVGIMAFAIDFGRMYLYRTQVHTASDAAALAGAERLMRLQFGAAADTAVAYGRKNLVENSVPNIGTGDIEPGTWNFTSRTFTPASGGNWYATGVNAVRATARYPARYTFGRMFGLDTVIRRATSVAAVGSARGSPCVRPVAVPYQILLDVLYGPGGKDATTYALTENDVSRLAAMTIADNILLKVGDSQLGIVNGNFYGVRLPPILYASGVAGNPWSGARDYSDAFGESCAELAQQMTDHGALTQNVGTGDWLQAENGNMAGPTGDGVATICQANGGTVPAGTKGNKDFTCNTPVLIKIAIWSDFGDPPGASGCGGKCFKVRYLGVFAVTGFKKDEGVYGYFSALASTGTFSPLPSPVKKIGLVQ